MTWPSLPLSKEGELVRLFPDFEVRLLHREDQSHDFRERGLSHFFEVAYLLTKKVSAEPLRGEDQVVRLQQAALAELASRGRAWSGSIAPESAFGPPEHVFH